MAEHASNVNLASTGSSSIFTPPFSGVTFMASAIIVRCTEATDISQAASISIGTNSSNYDNILPITSLTGLTSSGNFIRIPIDGIGFAVPKDTQIFVKVTTAATGTSQVGTVYIDGFYG